MSRPSLAAVLMALTSVALIGNAPQRASGHGQNHQQTPSHPRINLTAQSPWVPAGAPFLFGVRIAGAEPRAQVRVSVHRPVKDRIALDQMITSNDAGHELFNLDLLPIEDQPPGPRGTKQLSVLISTRESGPTARTRDPGIYPVQIRLQRPEPDGTILAHLTTYLIRVPEKPARSARLRAALMVRVHVPLRINDSGAPEADRSGEASVRTLTDALQGHANLPTTLVPTPQSLEALQNSRDEPANELLAQVRALRRRNHQVLAPPYVRLDASAWVEANLVDELASQQLVGTQVVTAMFPDADSRTWAADGDLTPTTVGRLRDSGVRQLVVPERNLASLDPATFSDSVTEPFKINTDIGIPIPAVQIDGRLQSAFRRIADPVLGANELLAELALMSFEQRGLPGGVVLAPPEDWQPSPAFLRVLLDGLAPANPLITATTVDHLFAQVPPAGSNGSAVMRNGEDRGVDLVRTLAPNAAPALGTFPDHLRIARQRLASYGTMVEPASSRSFAYDRLLRLAGAADLSRDRQDLLFGLVNSGLSRRFAGIKSPARERVTLTARNANFPLTLQSSLGYPVNVVIDLRASNRLTFPDGQRIQRRLVGPRTRIKLRVRAPVSGDTPLQVTVRSPDGRIVLAETRYTVRSTAVSGVGVVLTSGAALFLVIWWVRHWRRSARTRRNGSPVP